MNITMMCLSAWCVCVNVQTEIDFMWILFIPFSQDSSSSSSDSEDDKKKKKKKKDKKKKKKKVMPEVLNFQLTNFSISVSQFIDDILF